MHTAVSQLHEGTLLRIYNLLALLYPECIKIRGSLRFELDHIQSSFLHLITSLERLAFDFSDLPPLAPSENVKITSQLWDHQQETVKKIIDGITLFKKLGFGDASSVGAGKTLTALAVMAQIL
mgnify:CR=1 FL=1